MKELKNKINKAKRVMLDYGDSEKVFLYDDVKKAVFEFEKIFITEFRKGNLSANNYIKFGDKYREVFGDFGLEQNG